MTASVVDDLAPGSVVVVRDEEWLVLKTEPSAAGVLLHVMGLGELVRETEATFYTSLDHVEVLDPAAARVTADGSPRYRTARLWLEATLRKTAVPLTETALTVSTEALADPLAYQQTAVRKALDPANLRPRILLADAVGLGKTLEIGMILSELVRRGRGERILIVTPRHILEQMQNEMWSRFALPFVRLDSAGIQRVRQKLPATRNPFTYFKRVIISIDTLKSDQYRPYLEKHRWDAVVIDESHNVTNASAQNNKLARLLARTSDALILASATPHNGRKESFAQLIRMLDPSAVRPDGELVEDEVARLVIRRHRHSPEVAQVVGSDWAERQEPLLLTVTASPAEDAVSRELEEVWLYPAAGRSPYSGGNVALFPWTLAKAFLSSPQALAETVKERKRRILNTEGTGREVHALDRLLELAEVAKQQPSGKYLGLVEHLRGLGVAKGSAVRAVVFAERIATLNWLKATLPADLGVGTEAVEMLHGGLADVEQQRIVESFKQESSPIRVLVTGDMASEGVNLHSQCHELVHYDIPWSLIRIEQRNGRIDRYGQKFPPRITTLVLDPSGDRFAGDVRILARLIEREHEAHTALGDVASLMGKHDVEAEEDAIRRALAAGTGLDQVVRSPAAVLDGDDFDAFFWRVVQDDRQAEGPVHARWAGSGLYPSPVDFLDEALQAAYITPGDAPDDGGVSWRRHDGHGIAELVPPADLMSRLEVLPQSYLADRRVTSKLQLATTAQRGAQQLAAALSDDSDSTWPEAHYLGPLHPVLEWASDRALASLGRNQVFAVRADVEVPTVLLLGTLTNRRGHVVSSAWITVTFPAAGDTAFALVEPHASAAAALAGLGWRPSSVNPGPVGQVDRLDAMVGPAVHKARAQMRTLFAAAEADVTERVATWSHRLRAWEEEAGTLIQRQELRQRRLTVEQERGLVTAMGPDQQLVRPLLVVVPTGWDAR